MEVLESRYDTESKKDDEQPRACVQPFVQIVAYSRPDGDGEDHGHPHSAEKTQRPNRLFEVLAH